jgi:hypothetical protein
MWLPYPPDIARSFGENIDNDLFFFFGSFSLSLQDIPSRLLLQPASQALSVTYLPVKREIGRQFSWRYVAILGL